VPEPAERVHLVTLIKLSRSTWVNPESVEAVRSVTSAVVQPHTALLIAGTWIEINDITPDDAIIKLGLPATELST
jgi:hypothetical protein